MTKMRMQLATTAFLVDMPTPSAPPVVLNPGDVVECRIEKIGTIVNTVVSEVSSPV